jgi:hypothetical protein
MAKETVICTYRVRPAAEARFVDLLREHWSTLRELEFVTDDEAVVYRGVDEPTFVEIFTWVDGGFGRAHEHPDVLAIWERMDPLLEERDGRPKWEFPHYQPVRG